jgi:hypothetical protein
MLFRMLGKLTWFTTKLTVKYVVIPIALTALWAAVLEKASEKIRPNGKIEVAA